MLARMRYLQAAVERGINQSPRATTFQYWSNLGILIAGAVFLMAGGVQEMYPVALVGALFIVIGLVGLLRAEVYAIARLFVAAAKA